MLKLLKLNQFILFIILICPWLIIWFFNFDNIIVVRSISILRYFLLLLWFLLLDQELMKRMPVKIELSNTLFLINIVLIFLSFSSFFILAEPGEVYTITGIKAIPFLYLFYAFFQIYSHLSKLLTYVEEEKEVPLNKRVGEMVLFFFFFIGVFLLQPRIIAALGKPEVISVKYKKFNDG